MHGPLLLHTHTHTLGVCACVDGHYVCLHANAFAESQTKQRTRKYLLNATNKKQQMSGLPLPMRLQNTL